MPKEFIHCRDFGRIVPVGDGTKDDPYILMPLDSTAVKVGWSKESEHLELAIVKMVDGAFEEHGEDVLYIQLDRNGANRLIRYLRQGRDDAFGRDE